MASKSLCGHFPNCLSGSFTCLRDSVGLNTGAIFVTSIGFTSFIDAVLGVPKALFLKIAFSLE